MLPTLINIAGAPWPVLPEGVHCADFTSVADVFATNHWRRELFSGLVEASRNLAHAGCLRLYLDGSYVTGKPKPNDYDACWDPTGVDNNLLDPVLLDFSNLRAAQKVKFKGEFFPSSLRVKNTGSTFIEFFQIERFTGFKKGIVLIEITNDPVIQQ